MSVCRSVFERKNNFKCPSPVIQNNVADYEGYAILGYETAMFPK
jgi:hypothetical protein